MRIIKPSVNNGAVWFGDRFVDFVSFVMGRMHVDRVIVRQKRNRIFDDLFADVVASIRGRSQFLKRGFVVYNIIHSYRQLTIIRR